MMRAVPAVQRSETIVSRAFRESVRRIRKLIDESSDPDEIARHRAVLATFPKELTDVC